MASGRGCRLDVGRTYAGPLPGEMEILKRIVLIFFSFRISNLHRRAPSGRGLDAEGAAPDVLRVVSPIGNSISLLKLQARPRQRLRTECRPAIAA
jgi:hypothetical protein